MEDRKAKFIVFVAVALIAFMCSAAVYSMTGGLSDWIVSGINDNEDANNNGYLDSSEDSSLSIESDGNSENGDGLFGGVFSSFSSNDNSQSSSGDEPDLLARILRGFIGGSATTDTYYTDDGSAYYEEDTSGGFDIPLGSNGDSSYDLDELFSKADNKLNEMFN